MQKDTRKMKKIMSTSRFFLLSLALVASATAVYGLGRRTRPSGETPARRRFA
jgi:hypothetical protein